MIPASKGALEADIAGAVTRFHREQQGRGPGEVRAFLVGDLVLVRCTSVFTPVEAKLSASEDGRKLIKSARQELRSINHREIEDVVASLVGCAVLRSHCDFHVEAAEQIEVYVLEQNVEKQFAGKR